MKQTALNPKKITRYLLVGVAEVLVLLLLGAFLFLAVAGLVGVAFGFNAFGSTNDYQAAQLLFWSFALLSFFCYTFQRLLKNRTGTAKVTLRWIFIACVPILALSGFIGSIELSVNATKSTACNLSSTLDSAVYATYPIATSSEAGSAFAVDGEGTLVTAYHVIAGAQTVYMNIAGDQEPMTVLRTDPADDLALLHYSKPTPHFIGLNTNPALGSDVYALGYPGNTFSQGKSSITKGVVSRIVDNSDVRAADNSVASSLSFIQTDAAINPGNSGGPLVDKCGVVGVVDAVSDSENLHQYGLGVSEQNISYAISALTLKSFLK